VTGSAVDTAVAIATVLEKQRRFRRGKPPQPKRPFQISIITMILVELRISLLFNPWQLTVPGGRRVDRKDGIATDQTILLSQAHDDWLQLRTFDSRRAENDRF